MIQPKSLKVAQKLRESKLLTSALWDIRPKNWSEKHYSEWESILKGLEYDPIKKVNPRQNLHNKVKVVRISDGYIFNSIGDCKTKEGLHGVLMRQLLKEETKYKKVI